MLRARALIVAAAWVLDGAASVRLGSIGRRSTLHAGAAAVTVAAGSPAPSLAAGLSAGLSQAELGTKLSRVPLFVVTNRNEQPYLTEVTPDGRRSGFFFLGPREAIQCYQDIKAFDAAAALSVVSLDTVWFDLPRTDAEAAAAPQPKAGTSTDLRLFSLRPLDGELDAANALLKAAGAPPLGARAVPLFYSSTLTLPVDGREEQPYFFRAADLSVSLGQAGRGEAAPPALVTDLASVAARLSSGWGGGPPPILVAASEASAVIERMGLGGTSALGGEGVAAPADPLTELARSTPFAGGRK